MIHMTESQMAEYLRRSYTAVDGLWFMKTEERYGFDTALDVDEDVWKVFPKIQVRMLKKLGGVDAGLQALADCLSAKLNIDNFTFYIGDVREDGFDVVVTGCPWHQLMIKSGREGLSGKVGTRICRTEYGVWASEFGCRLHFENSARICTGGGSCVLRFSGSDQGTSPA